MITIEKYKYSVICELCGKNKAIHSLGTAQTPPALRKLLCNDCLKDIISEGLKAITLDERAAVFEPYVEEVEEENIITGDDEIGINSTGESDSKQGKQSNATNRKR